MSLPGPEHLIFIPAVLGLGLLLGWTLGARTARNAIARAQQRARD